MEHNYAHYLKHENAIKALIELLDKLGIKSTHRDTRFGRIRSISEGEMELFYRRMYNKKREQ